MRYLDLKWRSDHCSFSINLPSKICDTGELYISTAISLADYMFCFSPTKIPFYLRNIPLCKMWLFLKASAI